MNNVNRYALTTVMAVVTASCQWPLQMGKTGAIALSVAWPSRLTTQLIPPRTDTIRMIIWGEDLPLSSPFISGPLGPDTRRVSFELPAGKKTIIVVALDADGEVLTADKRETIVISGQTQRVGLTLEPGRFQLLPEAERKLFSQFKRLLAASPQPSALPSDNPITDPLIPRTFPSAITDRLNDEVLPKLVETLTEVRSSGGGLTSSLSTLPPLPLNPAIPYIIFAAETAKTNNVELFRLTPPASPPATSADIAPLTETGAGVRNIEPKIHPMGRWIAFLSNRAGEAGLQPKDNRNNYDIWLMTGNRVGLVRGTVDQDVKDIAWSADGRNLIYTTASGPDADLNLISENRISIPIPQAGTDEYWPDWSPDNQKIAFAAAPSGTGVPGTWENFQIYAMDVPLSEFSKTSPMTESPLGSANYSPAWSPTGNRLAYVHRATMTSPPDLWETSFNRAPFNVSNTPDEGEIRPVWSPKGDRLLFVKVTADGQQYLCYTDADLTTWAPGLLFTLPKPQHGLAWGYLTLPSSELPITIQGGI